MSGASASASSRRTGLVAWVGLICVAGAAAGCASPLAAPITIEWPTLVQDQRAPVLVRGLPQAQLDAWSRTPDAQPMGQLLGIFVDVDGDPPPVLGRYRLARGGLLFEPRFAWKQGLTYRAVVQSTGPGAAEPWVERHAFPAPERLPSTQVAAIYPSAGVLPENVLRFYVHFSAPMSRGEAYEHVRLMDADGRGLEEVFLSVKPELWDPDTTRLTLMLDPGRIKRGLLRSRELGAPLLSDGEYTLVIDASWLDGHGVPLATPFEHRFRTTTTDRVQPSVADWHMSLPRAETYDLLLLSFPEPLDRALLLRLLTVLDADAEPLAGKSSVGQGETQWGFRPHERWRAGRYRIEIDTRLEDLAGNSLERPFEERLEGSSNKPQPIRRIALELEVGHGPATGLKKL